MTKSSVTLTETKCKPQTSSSDLSYRHLAYLRKLLCFIKFIFEVSKSICLWLQSDVHRWGTSLHVRQCHCCQQSDNLIKTWSRRADFHCPKTRWFIPRHYWKHRRHRFLHLPNPRSIHSKWTLTFFFTVWREKSCNFTVNLSGHPSLHPRHVVSWAIRQENVAIMRHVTVLHQSRYRIRSSHGKARFWILC
mgnify:CR=1 FL=1